MASHVTACNTADTSTTGDQRDRYPAVSECRDAERLASLGDEAMLCDDARDEGRRRDIKGRIPGL
jgi:hypothetical protein